MIELTNDNEKNIQIIGKSRRYNAWYDLEQSLEELTRMNTDYPIKNKEELDKIDNAIRLLNDLKTSA